MRLPLKQPHRMLSETIFIHAFEIRTDMKNAGRIRPKDFWHYPMRPWNLNRWRSSSDFAISSHQARTGKRFRTAYKGFTSAYWNHQTRHNFWRSRKSNTFHGDPKLMRYWNSTNIVVLKNMNLLFWYCRYACCSKGKKSTDKTRFVDPSINCYKDNSFKRKETE